MEAISKNFQQTPIGPIPSDWGLMTIEDIATQETRKNTEVQDLPVLSCSKYYGFVDSLKYFKKKVYSDDTSNYKVIERNCFGFPSNHIEEGSIGYQDVYDAGIVSPIYTVFRTNDLVHGYYLFRLLKTDKYRNIFAASTKASVDRRGSLRWKEFSKIHVPIPPLPEQKKIASILSAVDNKLDLIDRKITATRTLKKGLMQRLFSQGVGTRDADGHWQPHTEFKECELGRIPAGWESLPLNKVCSKIGDGIHTTPKYVSNSEFFFVNGNNLKNGKLVITDSTKCISEAELQKHQIDLCHGTILMSINGTIGNLAFYNGEKVVFGKSAAYLSASNKINREYLFYLLSTPFIQKSFGLELTGTTIKNLSLKSIRNTVIPLPALDEQAGIAKILSSFDKKIEHLTTIKAQTKDLKKGLMQKLLTGQWRVNV